LKTTVLITSGPLLTSVITAYSYINVCEVVEILTLQNVPLVGGNRETLCYLNKIRENVG
jgi:hypothetical protein